MDKRTEEWLKQSRYDMETADFMYSGGRYLYAVFMCHLSIEKALKGLFYQCKKDIPPRTHSLIYLLDAIGKRPPETLGRFIVKLSEASIPTRYPEQLDRIQKEYTAAVVSDIVQNGKEVLQWINLQLSE